ncbi:predicted protein [Phaeodactylum tricornutum CCAP 1055/1]|uniref:Uncharacterized protein n=2 Tax=Phaeodactylum tricornutum TaxID=2850 RepID=B7G3P9_PHATC|nr:predicted protein [Phaeodactylum tricornutum CCAP 1055/1]EEC46864.1 predicted protein [Phaeodactylum tricornutum CCAP 1055/1]|eukprot:XP_002181650.1 predicted protein [Phaeodactylum tricornutum CCAP 1055/1]
MTNAAAIPTRNGGGAHVTTPSPRLPLFALATKSLRTPACSPSTVKNAQIACKHNLARFQENFTLANDDWCLTATTGSLGYANVLAAAPSLAPATVSDTLSLPFSALSVSHSSVSSPDMTYCWTHGTSKNRRHTSATCKDNVPGHRDDATASNPIGGSTKIWTAPKPPK